MIEGIQFENLEAEKYWSFPSKYKYDKKAEIKNLIFSGDYAGALKKDGAYARYVKDGETRILQGRSLSVGGTYLNKINHVPQVRDILEKLPDGTVLLTELYFPKKKGSRYVTTIMGCLEAKAIDRQKVEQDKLHCYIFDVWAWKGKSLLNSTFEERIKILDEVRGILYREKYVEIAEYATGEKLYNLLDWAMMNDEEGIVMTRLDSKPEPGKRTARKTLKVKQELNNEIDCFLTGVYKGATKEYTGQDIESWCFWYSEKTGKKYNRNMYKEYSNGDPLIPITKGFFFDWAGSVEIGLIKSDGSIYPLGWISGVNEQIKEEIVTENEKWKYKVCKVMAMQIEEDTKKLRHGKILEFRTDISYNDCEYSKVFEE